MMGGDGRSAAGSLVRSGGGGAGGGEGEECGDGPNPWLLVYRDRMVGWRGVLSMFRWLQSHGCPSAVSGSHHRQQLLAALRHLGLAIRLYGCPGQQHQQKQPHQQRQQQQRQLPLQGLPSEQGSHPYGSSSSSGGSGSGCSGCRAAAGGVRVAERLAAELLAAAPDVVPCLLALLSNEGCLTVELAAGALADLMALDEQRLAEAAEVLAEAAAAGGRGGGDGGAEQQRQRRRRQLDAPSIMQHVLLGSNSGRTIAAQLRDGVRSPGIVRQVTRCLVNLWACGPVPRVLPLLPPAAAAAGGRGGGAAGDGWAAVLPVLESGVWLLQEYSARGDPMRLIHTLITFRPGLTTTAATSSTSSSSSPSSSAAAAAAAVASTNTTSYRSASSASTTATHSDMDPDAGREASGSGSRSLAGRVSQAAGSSIRAGGGSHGTEALPTDGWRQRSWTGDVPAASTAASTGAPPPLTAIPSATPSAAAVLVGRDGRPVGGTAAALAALGGGTRVVLEAAGRGGAAGGSSGGWQQGGGRQVVELLGGGYDVLLPRGTLPAATSATTPAAPTAAAAASPPNHPTASHAPTTNTNTTPGSGTSGVSSSYSTTTPQPQPQPPPPQPLDREAEEFRLAGWVDPGSGEWLLVRSCVNVPFALTYRGYSDAHGCWGTYTVQHQPQQQQAAGGGGAAGQQGAGQGSSMVAGGLSVRAPRVFRLFRDPSLPPPGELLRLLAAMQEPTQRDEWHPQQPQRQPHAQPQPLQAVRQEQMQRTQQQQERQQQQEKRQQGQQGPTLLGGRPSQQPQQQQRRQKQDGQPDGEDSSDGGWSEIDSDPEEEESTEVDEGESDVGVARVANEAPVNQDVNQHSGPKGDPEVAVRDAAEKVDDEELPHLEPLLPAA
ncbi:hypothetical protein Agub_g9776 [Astrephomene gubernaculifera]|uniref:Uncharacterized protein n=1 Tax=Astrephomene gubernaculifera TaxID=47775 RepID=A0AAD3DTY4_9CHLO|nr:hypothetical protein Agub_g9776 [Astrephomene gubernaculifera]